MMNVKNWDRRVVLRDRGWGCKVYGWWEGWVRHHHKLTAFCYRQKLTAKMADSSNLIMELVIKRQRTPGSLGT